MRRRLLTILFTLLAPLAAHAEWIVSECSAYTPYDCGTITATGETVHVGGVACNFLPFGTVVIIDGREYVVNDRCGIDNCIDIFMESYERQRNLQALTARSLETLASMRSEADALILDIWNQVERKYAEVMPNEKRLELCRAYGLIYYYRTGEKEEITK